MFALLAAALLAADVPPATPPGAGDPRQAYQAAREAAGRSPDEQVRLALWCEAHGLDAERARHLAQAVLADPGNAAARGLLGLVARGDRWLRPEAVADQLRADAALAAGLAEYDARRSATPYTADNQWSLAQWAEGKGLKDQARAHLTAVVRLDPRRDVAWKKLGYRKVEGRWATDAELAAERADAEAQKAADKKWRPLLQGWKAQLAKAATRGEAEEGLLSVTDPRAVRQVEAVLLAGATTYQDVALRVLAQIDSAAASRLIVMIAIAGDDPNVRRAALETLRQRDPRDFADLPIRMLRPRIEYQVDPVGGPGSTGRLVVKQPRQQVQRLYATPAVPNYLAWLTQVSDGSPTLTYHYQGQQVVRDQALANHAQSFRFQDFMQLRPADPGMAAAVHQVQQNAPALIHEMASHNRTMDYLDKLNPERFQNRAGFRVETIRDTTTPFQTDTTIPLAAMVAEYAKTAAAAQQQMARDVAAIDAYNRAVNESNDRLTLVLRAVSGQDHGSDISGWASWLVDLSGATLVNQSESDVPTATVIVPLDYQPRAIPIGQTTYVAGQSTTATHFEITPWNGSTLGPRHADCFAAGTLVRTITGPRPIEAIRMGDLVLTQSTATGALSYQPVLSAHHNPPSPTFRVQIEGGEAIGSSPFHRFWKVGQGWVMARDLKAGDRLRLLSGTAVVKELQVGGTQLVYNLDVAGNADFFAGASGTLVHDNTLLDQRVVPFDRPDAATPAAVAAAR